MKPKIVMHTQISLDGCIKGFEDTGIYYRLANQFGADMVLFGSDTVLAVAEQTPPEKESDFNKPHIDPNDSRPYVVVPDSRGRLRNLHLFRSMPYLKDVIVLISGTTPKEYIDYLKERDYDFIISGEDHVNYEKAFQVLSDQYQCKIIRTDTGGILTNILLEQGLIDEISLIISPVLIGTATPVLFRSLSLQEKINLKLISHTSVDENYISLIYKVLVNNNL